MNTSNQGTPVTAVPPVLIFESPWIALFVAIKLRFSSRQVPDQLPRR